MNVIDPKELRKSLLYIAHKSNAGHLGTCLSAIEILSSIYSTIDVKKIKDQDPTRDRVILSKGHAAAALYTTMFKAGLLTEEEFNTYYSSGSLLSGHANHFHPLIEHSTGALGHGLSAGVGMALGFLAKGIQSNVYVVLGDGELNEGSNYEALMYAGHLKLKNLCVFIDNNKLGGIGKTDDFCTLEPLTDKLKAFNFETFRVDGHNLGVLFECLDAFKKANRPVAIICDTVKGKGVPFMENLNAWHYRSLNDETYKQALDCLI